MMGSLHMVSKWVQPHGLESLRFPLYKPLINNSSLINSIVFMQVIIVRGCLGGRRHSSRGGGVTPPVASMLEGSNPKDKKKSSNRNT
jgi:hypothetical protein